MPWLTATVGSSGTIGTTPGTVTVAVNSGLIAPGQYSGLVTITSAGAIGSPISINVLLNVGATTALAVTPSALTFGASGSWNDAGALVPFSRISDFPPVA